jgi:hypothetical protein
MSAIVGLPAYSLRSKAIRLRMLATSAASAVDRFVCSTGTCSDRTSCTLSVTCLHEGPTTGLCEEVHCERKVYLCNSNRPRTPSSRNGHVMTLHLQNATVLHLVPIAARTMGLAGDGCWARTPPWRRAPCKSLAGSTEM